MVQWQNIDVPLSVGVSTRDDAKLLPPLKLLDLQNSVFTKGGALKKRNGYTYLNKTTLDASPATISAAKQLATRGDELVLLDGSSLYGYTETLDRWENRGTLMPLDVDVTPVSNASAAQINGDCGTANGITVYAWEDSASAAASVTSYYAIYDAAGVELQAATALGTYATPRVLVVGNIIIVMLHDLTANDLKLKRIDTSSAANLVTSTASAIIALGYSDISEAVGTTYDACSTGSYIVFAAATTGNTIRVGVVTSAGALGVNGTGFGTAATTAITSSAVVTPVAISVNSSSNTGLLFYENSGDWLVRNVTNVVSGSGAITFSGATTVDTGTTVGSLACLASSTTGTGHLYWHADAVLYYAALAGGSLSSTASRPDRCKLASKPFLIGSAPFVHIYYSSTLQASYFLVDATFAPYARVHGGIASRNDSRIWPLPSVSSSYEWAATYKRRVALPSNVFTEPSLSKVSYSTSDPRLPRYSHKNVLYIGSGFLWQYDGRAPTESGFLLYPEKNTAVASNGSGTLTSSSSYSYAAYWEWWDALGNREMSAASEVFTVALGATDDTVTLTFHTLPFTWKQGTRDAPNLALYRSAADGTTRYRVSSFNPASTAISAAGYYVANVATSDTVTYEDRMPDSTLTSRELDPFNPNDAGLQQLDNIAPPAPNYIHATQDRFWVVSAENPRRVYYSKLPQAETAIEFNDGLYLEFDEEIMAVADTIGRPVFFSADHVYVIDGEGPDNNGVGAYSRVEQLPVDVGCYVPDTLVETPRGWMFLSKKGFRLLTTGLQVDPNFGNEPDTYRSQTFTGATVMPDANAVRFLTSSGRTLSYDYERDQWSTFTGVTGVSSVTWDGVYCYVTSAGQVAKEASGTYTDNGTNIAQLVETSWIKPGGVQGFARLQRVLLLASWKSSHTLTVEVAYDFEDAYSETFTVTPTAAVIAGTLAYQIRHRLQRQKCNAIKFRITEVPGSGAGLELNALSLRVGVKGGQNRLGDRTI